MKINYSIKLFCLKTVYGFLSVLTIIFFYTTKIAPADFGYRIDKLELNITQKFPPSIAFDLLEDSDQVNKKYIIETIPLTVGFPDVGPLKLEELSFGMIEEIRSDREMQKISKNEDLNINNNFFSEEEKTRLRMAKLDRELVIDDLLPRHEVSFGEKFKTILNHESKEKNNYHNSVKVFKPNNISNLDSKTRIDSLSNSGNFIKGQVEFAHDGGLHFAEEHTIQIQRFEEGIPKELAQVDWQSGTFTINLKSKQGILVGRIHNGQGKIEGEGQISVTDFLKTNNQTIFLKKIGARPPIIASSAYGKHRKQYDSKMNLAGFFSSKLKEEVSHDINLFGIDSEMVIQASSQKHQTTISMVNLLSGAEIVLLPENMLNGLTEILSEQDIQLDLDRGDSLIWGTVKLQGRPIEGATIIESQGKVSYFGGLYLPDQTRVQTSENGMFAMVVHQPGWNEFDIELKDGRRVHLNALVYPGKVTQVDAEIPNESVEVTVRSFDAFSGEPVRSVINFQQLNDTVDTGIQGMAIVSLPKSQNLSFVTVNPDSPYENIRSSYSTPLDYYHLPLIRKKWLDEIKSNYKINEISKTGIIVGFVQGDEFIVEINNKESNSQVVYFDHMGAVSSKGLPGGGFIIFNLEEENANIIIASLRSQLEVSRIVRPEIGLMQVLNINLELK